MLFLIKYVSFNMVSKEEIIAVAIMIEINNTILKEKFISSVTVIMKIPQLMHSN